MDENEQFDESIIRTKPLYVFMGYGSIGLVMCSNDRWVGERKFDNIFAFILNYILQSIIQYFHDEWKEFIQKLGSYVISNIHLAIFCYENFVFTVSHLRAMTVINFFICNTLYII